MPSVCWQHQHVKDKYKAVLYSKEHQTANMKNKQLRKYLLVLLSFFCGSTLPAQKIKTDALEAKIEAATESKDYFTVAKLCEQILKIKPRNTYWLTRAGTAYFNLTNYPKAKEKYSLAVLYSDKKDEVLYANLGAAYNYLNEDEKAYDNHRKAMAIKQTPQTVFNSASGANNLNRSKDCILIMDKAQIPLEPAFQSLYGRSYLKLKQPQKAIEHFEKFLQDYNPAAAAIDVLDTTTEKGYLMQAYSEALIQRAKDKSATTPNWQRIAELYASLLQTTESDQAERSLGNAALACINLQPQWKPAFETIMLSKKEQMPRQKVLTYFALNDYDKAEATAKDWLQNNADDNDEKTLVFMRFVSFARTLNSYLHTITPLEKSGFPLLQKIASKYAGLLPEANDIKTYDYTLEQRMNELAELTNAYIHYINQSESLNITAADELLILKNLIMAFPESTVRNDLIKKIK